MTGSGVTHVRRNMRSRFTAAPNAPSDLVEAGPGTRGEAARREVVRDADQRHGNGGLATAGWLAGLPLKAHMCEAGRV
jgi:hypothetical protein